MRAIILALTFAMLCPPVFAQLSDSAKNKIRAQNAAKKAKAAAKKNKKNGKTEEERLEELQTRIATNSAQQKKRWEEWESKQAALPAESRPFDIKGDRLGMELPMFRGKYYRSMLPNDPIPAPFCSDIHPDTDNPSLFYKAEMAKVGIVNGRTTFPYEEHGDDPFHPTIAGTPVEIFIYHFVDQKLYEMTVYFDQSDFDQVISAIKAKYGDPTTEKAEQYQNAFGAKFEGMVSSWQNKSSLLLVIERAGKLDQSLLLVQHKELKAVANERLSKLEKPKLDDF